jgi:hypothetical protein
LILSHQGTRSVIRNASTSVAKTMVGSGQKEVNPLRLGCFLERVIVFHAHGAIAPPVAIRAADPVTQVRRAVSASKI